MSAIKRTEILKLADDTEGENKEKLLLFIKSKMRDSINNNKKKLKKEDAEYLEVIKKEINIYKKKLLKEITPNNNIEKMPKNNKNKNANKTEIKEEEKEIINEVIEEKDPLKELENAHLESVKEDIINKEKEINLIKENKEYIKINKDIEKLKMQIKELEDEKEEKFNSKIKEIEKEIIEIKKPNKEELIEKLTLKAVDLNLSNEERINIIKLISSLSNNNNKKEKKPRSDASYPKCPNGCGFKRNTLKGFKKHLGFCEGADNCSKKNKVIKTEDELIKWAKENNIKD